MSYFFGAIQAALAAGGGGGPTAYRYFRWVCKPEGSDVVSFMAIQLVVDTTTYPTSAMTANNAPSPLVASASSGTAWNAFDNNTAAAYWQLTSGGTTGWIQLDLGAGNAIVPTAIKMAPRTTGTRDTDEVSLYGSNTGAFSGEETLIKAWTGLAAGWTSGAYRTLSI